jgi:hypothetical protein
MLARMTTKSEAMIYHTKSTDPIKQLIASNSQHCFKQFSPERAVEAQKKLNEQLSKGLISPATFYVPIANSCSELQQCFSQSYVFVPSDQALSYTTIMRLIPHVSGNKLEAIMLACPNKALLEAAVLRTTLITLDILAGSYCVKEPLAHSLFAAARYLCNETPTYKISEIHGNSFEFTAQTAPAALVMMAHSLLPNYLECPYNNDIGRYVAALYDYCDYFNADVPHHIVSVLVPDVPRLQTYLARQDIPAAVIVGDKELTNPKEVLIATKPEYVPVESLDLPLQEGITVVDGTAMIPQAVKLKNYLAELPGIGFTED